MSYHDDEEYREPARLDAEGEENLTQRLYYRPMQLAEQKEQERQDTLARTRDQKRIVISKQDEDKLVARMYDQQLERFEASKADRQRQADAEVHKNDKTMSASDIEEQVRRMYDDERKKSQMKRAELHKRYVPEAEEKKIDKERLKECVERLYHVDYEKRDEELFKKYVYPFDPKTTKMSRASEEAMASRLSTTKGSS